MDARRLGGGIGLPLAFLQAAAPGYLTDAEWDAAGEDWLEQALAYTALPCKGARGPLTRIRPRPASSGATWAGTSNSGEEAAGGPAGSPGVSLYRLADYLDQHGRRTRQGQFPPPGFWTAAAGYAFPGDQAAFGAAADARGLYRVAAQLYKNAAARGNLQALSCLSNPPHYLRADGSPMRWAMACAPLDDPASVAGLLDSQRYAGAQEQAAALLDRDPAAQVSLDNPMGVARLLDILQVAGAQEQAAALGRRAAAHAPLDDPAGVTGLLGSLSRAGAQGQVAALLDRDPAAQVSLGDLPSVGGLLDSLRHAGAQEQAAALARRAAAHAPLDDPAGVAELLNRMREVAPRYAGAWQAGARQQVAALLDRDPAAQVSLDDPVGVGRLLGSLVDASVGASHSPFAARVPPFDPSGRTRLVNSLRYAGAQEQAAALGRRAAAHAPLDDPTAVARLLNSLDRAGAQEQAAALGRRAAAHAPLDDPMAVARLLDSLSRAGAQEQAAALTESLPGAGIFGLFLKQEGNQDQFRFGREANGSPARPWSWKDLD